VRFFKAYIFIVVCTFFTAHVSPASEPIALGGAAVGGALGAWAGYQIAQRLCASKQLEVTDEQAIIHVVLKDNQTKKLILTLSASGFCATATALIVYCMLHEDERREAARVLQPVIIPPVVIEDEEVPHLVRQNAFRIDPVVGGNVAYEAQELRRRQNEQRVGQVVHLGVQVADEVRRDR